MSSPSGSTRIRKTAAIMSAATAVVAIALLAAGVWLWIDDLALDNALSDPAISGGAAIALTPTTRAIVLALGVPVIALILWSLWNAFWLFRAYRAGDVVTLEIGRRIRRMGIALVAFPIASTITNVLSSIVVSLDAPDGQRHIVLSIGSETVIMAITGAMLILAGWSMVEASRIADENRQFI